MANPQKENGHIDIANEIAEALARTNLNGYESRYLWVLWRKTYGWHKKEDIITNSQFSDYTGIKRPHVWRTENTLIARNIVTKLGNKLSFNKYYTQWRELPKMVTVTKLGTEVTQNGNFELPKMVHTKENTKETIQKKVYTSIYSFDVDFWDLYPKKVEKKKSQEKWERLSDETKAFIRDDIPKRKFGRKWKEGFIENPMTYLNGERWSDEIEPIKTTLSNSITIRS